MCESIDCLRSMDILMMLILPICEQRICFHLFVFFLTSFIVFYGFPYTGLLPPWLNLFLGTLFYFIFLL